MDHLSRKPVRPFVSFVCFVVTLPWKIGLRPSAARTQRLRADTAAGFFMSASSLAISSSRTSIAPPWRSIEERTLAAADSSRASSCSQDWYSTRRVLRRWRSAWSMGNGAGAVGQPEGRLGGGAAGVRLGLRPQPNSRPRPIRPPPHCSPRRLFASGFCRRLAFVVRRRRGPRRSASWLARFGRGPLDRLGALPDALRPASRAAVHWPRVRSRSSPRVSP